MTRASLVAGVAGLFSLVGVGFLVIRSREHPPEPVIPPTPRVQVVWSFESPHRGGFVAAPTIHDGTLYAPALLARGFRYRGIVHALDLDSGRERWHYDDDQQMRPSASAVVVSGNRLYFGEGMHSDFVCQLRCLNRETQALLWKHEAHDHIEAAPTIDSGVVYCSAGNDGVYALDADTGKPKWHFTSDIHTDSRPLVHQGRVFIGTGPSRRYQTQQVIALNAQTGIPVWRIPADLPAWGSPSAAGDRLFVGLGNGRMMTSAEPPETPAGALLCLRTENGQELWRITTADAVFQQPTLADGQVYFASRDGWLRSVQQLDGKVNYAVSLGSAVIAPPTVNADSLYTITVAGQLRQHDRSTGAIIWSYDLAESTGSKPLFFSPVQVHDGKLYVAGELGTPSGNVAVIYCLQAS